MTRKNVNERINWNEKPVERVQRAENVGGMFLFALQMQ